MPACVLIVEDHRENRELMAYLLDAFGHATLLATSAAEGIRVARQASPDLILMDLQMPGMDGYEAVRLLKSDPDLGRCPVLAVTALAMVGDRERIMASGFDGYLPKPISASSFVGEVEQFLPPELRTDLRHERAS